MQHSFRVRRDVVRRALVWLKQNNPKYYGDIQVDEQRLASLPEDDVPIEVEAIVRQNMDDGLVDQESEGYVPEDDDDNADLSDIEGDGPEDQHMSTVSHGEHNRDSITAAAASLTDNVSAGDRDPGVIPLHISGGVDTDGTELNATELMRWGLANLWDDSHEGGYAIRYGTGLGRDLIQKDRMVLRHLGMMTIRPKLTARTSSRWLSHVSFHMDVGVLKPSGVSKLTS